ncbi:hypothetical protein PJF56_16875 [Roseofilum sp. BLCC_M91]|uniref:Uncharacterized protein n=1 Tax=Roseofilum halophilum BLCC-M91 TaxID=3022259 RepID=A0ABT7BMZ3_9CYAN|nr:hypothetical protein [Roseofilum halophilum]MDJ1180536.1 hypothetical protein [Roseofilum halophilum BLCC-M91]
MGFHGWSSEGKLNIEAGSPFVDLLGYLGSGCGPGVYAYKSKILQVKQSSKPVYRLLINKLGQVDDYPHLIIDFKPQDPYHPVEAWHYSKSNTERIGSVNELAIRTLMTVLSKKLFN